MSTKAELEAEIAALKAKNTSLVKASTVKKNANDRIQTKEKVKIVRFSGKTDPDDNDDIFLAINGHSLVLKRNVEIPLPERFIKLAEDATIKTYEFSEEGDISKTNHLQRFPFSVLRDSTWKEFFDYLKRK